MFGVIPNAGSWREESLRTAHATCINIYMAVGIPLSCSREHHA